MTEKKNKVPAESVAPEERSARAREKEEPTAQKQDAQEQPLTRETVTVFATLDETMLKAIETVATERNLTLVRLEEKVIDDFIAAKTSATPEQREVKSVEDFVNDENNRVKAENDAKRLYSFLTKDPIEQFAGKKFNRKDIVKRTNLSNNGALAMLNMLEVFGYVRYTGGKMEEFQFEFRPEEIHAFVRRQALAVLTEAAKDFVRYRALIEQDSSLNKKQRDKEIAGLKAEFRKLLA